MFKILLLAFLFWLAWRLFKAGRFVRGVMRTMEDAIAAAQGEQPVNPSDAAPPPARDSDRVTVHRKAGGGPSGSRLDAEDARFTDL